MDSTVVYALVSTFSGLVFVVCSRLIDRFLPAAGHSAAEDAKTAPVLPPP